MLGETIDYDGFAAFLALNDRRSTTIKRHLNNLRFLGRRGVNLDRSNTEAFLLKLKLDGKSNAYLHSLVGTLRVYGQFTKNQALKTLKGYTIRPSIKATMSDDEIETFLGLPVPFHSDKTNYKIWTVFFSICAFTGMRPGEVAHLKISDIDWGRGVFVIRQSKTNTPGLAPIPPNIIDLLKDHLATLKTDYLFPSKLGGNHYSAGGEAVFDNVDWEYNFKKRIKILGISRPKLSTYSLRHSYATRLLEENYDNVLIVKKLMRHNDLKSTLVYEHYTTKDIIQAQANLPLVSMGVDPKQKLKRWAKVLRDLRVDQDNRFEYELSEDGESIEFKVKIK